MPIRTDPVLPEEDWPLRLDVPEDGSSVGTLTLAYPAKLDMWSWEATRQLGVLADGVRFDDRIGWAASWMCSPYAFVTVHTLVVDGANWLRRDFVMPEFTPVADQLSQVLRPTD